MVQPDIDETILSVYVNNNQFNIILNKADAIMYISYRHFCMFVTK